ncbi:MAG: ATP phosphoribosyltransferase regulatory subunit [Devosiaceae bacterium]|nr:ATP phosphoribosyltransferase regulatory subunit [Devosiaceae bacterium MH13]
MQGIVDDVLFPLGIDLAARPDLEAKLEEFLPSAVFVNLKDIPERVDEFSEGAGLETEQVHALLAALREPTMKASETDGGIDEESYHFDYELALRKLDRLVGHTLSGAAAIEELRAMASLFRGAGYRDRISITDEVVRGLEYYTGPVYEAELLFPVTNEKGEEVVFGSVGGGGRYDGLVSRFRGEAVPATGFSIGVSRLMTALKNLGKISTDTPEGPVVVCVMDREIDALAAYQKMVQELRQAGVRAEMFQGNPKQFGKQLQYADRRNSPLCIIQGSDEREAGTVQIKDMIEGKREAAAIESNAAYKAARPGQYAVPQDRLIEEVKKRLAEQRSDSET